MSLENPQKHTRVAQHSDHCHSTQKKFGLEFPGVEDKKKEKESVADLWRRTCFLMRLTLQAALDKMNVQSQRVSLNSWEWWAFRVRNTYRTIVLRNQGLLAMEGTASSMRGCILMKLSVSSGNSLDTLYLSMDGEPAQLPGLRWEKRKMLSRESHTYTHTHKKKIHCIRCGWNEQFVMSGHQQESFY